MLRLGERDGRAFQLSAEERSRHLHILGASGTGKSKFLELLIRQDIVAGRGVCLIDPHGTLADWIVRFCASRRVQEHRKVHIIEPSDIEWSLAFNPLRMDGIGDPTFRVDRMVDTCAEVWGGENLDETPLLATCLQLVFFALAANDLTLAEATQLTQAKDLAGLRERLTKNLPNEIYESYWEDYRGLARRDLEERFSSTRRRLLRFLGKPAVLRMLGQKKRAIDIRQVMEDGDILIVNLATRNMLSEASARLIGALLTSEFYMAAMGRTEEAGRRRPYYLYIDECYDYLTGDIEHMLDQTRKFGLHLILAHQRLGQLRARSDAIFNGVMSGAQTKIVFGGLEDDDAEVMVRQIMRDSFNLERPKHSLDKPYAVGEELIWLESESISEGVSSSIGSSNSRSWTETRGLSDSTSASYEGDVFDQTRWQTGTTLSNGSNTQYGSGGGWTTNESSGQSRTTSHGRHQAQRSVYQILPTQVHTLEEEVHRAIVQLREQPNQRAIVKIRGRKAKGIRIPTVTRALASERDIQAFRDASRQASDYLVPAAEADAEIKARRTALAGAAMPTAPDFWEEEAPA